jgi:protein tyrosine/serine phosphatase
MLAALLALLPWTPVLAQPATAANDVRNFHKVAANLYRSGQPSEAGFRRLVRQYHIRTVINLRRTGNDEPIAIGLPLHLQRFSIDAGLVEQERGNVVAALRAMRAGMREGPTLVHCQHGSDRTGLIIALYRILYENKSKPEAVREMRQKALGFNAVWQNIPRFIDKVDVAQLKRAVEAP